MAHGACDSCGCSYSECECDERTKAKKQEAVSESKSKRWTEQGKAINRETESK